ncbi:hypothetical protein J6590_023728 [Homalodisca vitripennis]|nr:hypothetical protein J6590_023728 [Homalodisca vitripennis]
MYFLFALSWTENTWNDDSLKLGMKKGRNLNVVLTSAVLQYLLCSFMPETVFEGMLIVEIRTEGSKRTERACPEKTETICSSRSERTADVFVLELPRPAQSSGATRAAGRKRKIKQEQCGDLETRQRRATPLSSLDSQFPRGTSRAANIRRRSLGDIGTDLVGHRPSSSSHRRHSNVCFLSLKQLMSENRSAGYYAPASALAELPVFLLVAYSPCHRDAVASENQESSILRISCTYSYFNKLTLVYRFMDVKPRARPVTS